VVNEGSKVTRFMAQGVYTAVFTS